MILATRHGNRESRGSLFTPASLDFSQTGRIPLNSETGMSYAGKPVTFGNAVGIPAVLRAYRLISETVGAMPLQVVGDSPDGRQEPQRTAPQWAMLHDVPNPPYGNAMAVWSYAIVCMLRGGVVMQKLRARGQLIGVEPISPARYGGKPVWENGQLVAKIRDPATGKTTTLKLGSGQDGLYVPGILLEDPYIGVGVIEAERHALGNPIARQAFEGRFLANDGGVTVVLKNPADVDETQRKQIREGFEKRHRGQPGRPALMWGGWEMEKLSLSLQDAQFIESQKFTVLEVARMFGLPPRKLGETDSPPPKDSRQDDVDLLKYGLMPWIEKLCQGLHLDDDVFPDKALQPKFLTDGLLRAEPDIRNGAYLKARQAGWMTANEIRQLEGMPPHEGGDELQLTPVGGAANPLADDSETTPPQDKPA